MKLLIDMNLSPTWVEFLVDEGFQAVHWSQVGAPNAPDAVLMSWARDNGALVLTHDLDFGVLLALTHATGPSVVQLRADDVLPSAVGRDVVRVLRLRGDALIAGALVTIDLVKSRVRILPISS